MQCVKRRHCFVDRRCLWCSASRPARARAKRRLLTLPATLPNGCTITRGDIHHLGQFDERTGEIVLANDLPRAGELTILIHEALHMAESAMLQEKIIRRRTGEQFVTHAAPLVAVALVAAGAVPGLRVQDFNRLRERR